MKIKLMTRKFDKNMFQYLILITEFCSVNKHNIPDIGICTPTYTYIKQTQTRTHYVNKITIPRTY